MQVKLKLLQLLVLSMGLGTIHGTMAEETTAPLQLTCGWRIGNFGINRRCGAVLRRLGE
jgi:hypothetical protein